MLKVIGAPTFSRRHLSYIHYKSAHPRLSKECLKFAVLRHPETRINSLYKYILSGGNQLQDGDLLLKNELQQAGGGIDDFIRKFLTHSNVAFYPILRPQAYYICNSKKEIEMDFLLKYETLEKDYSVLRERLGFLPERLPVLNKSEEISVPLSKSLREHIKQIYSIDFDVFYE